MQHTLKIRMGMNYALDIYENQLDIIIRHINVNQHLTISTIKDFYNYSFITTSTSSSTHKQTPDDTFFKEQ